MQRASDRRASILAMALPTIVGNLVYSFLALASIKAVGGLGMGALAAVLAAERVLFALQCVFLIVTGATTALVAQNWGAGDRAAAIQWTKLSLTLVVIVSVLMTIGTWLAAPKIMALFDLSPSATVQAIIFLRLVSLFNIGSGIALVMAASLRAIGDAYTPLWAFGGANIVNIILLVFLVRGYWIFPGLGVAGAAYANGIAYTGAAIFLVTIWWFGGFKIRSKGGSFFNFTGTTKLLKIGTPASIEQFLLHFGLFAMMLIVSRFGANALTGYGAGVSLVSFSYVVGYGFAIASATVVGQQIGAGHRADARKSAWRASSYAVVLMVGLGFLIYGFGAAIGKFLGLSPAALVVLHKYLLILVIVQPLMALEFSLAGALRGAGKTRTNMLIALAGLFGGRLLIAVLFFLSGLGLSWIFASMIADYAIKATLYSLCIQSEAWTNPVIGRQSSAKPDDEEATAAMTASVDVPEAPAQEIY